ncbi:MAG TPA: hypothetical protein ENG26_02170 [Gammaproteobacteria bacterium]|nr:hypothetical protein [Gammaproteobacteria bacterium]
MTARKITLHCDIAVKDIACAAIRDYAHVAYPDGGSECAQVARYTLLELAADIDAGITGHSETVEISKRPRIMLKAAFEFYFNRMDEAWGATSTHQRRLFAELLEEKTITTSDLQAAVVADNSGVT